MDVTREPGRESLLRAIASYDRALDEYCTAGQVTLAFCDTQRAQLARVRTEPGAVAGLERGLSDAEPSIARHLHVLAAALRDARRR